MDTTFEVQTQVVPTQSQKYTSTQSLIMSNVCAEVHYNSQEETGKAELRNVCKRKPGCGGRAPPPRPSLFLHFIPQQAELRDRSMIAQKRYTCTDHASLIWLRTSRSLQVGTLPLVKLCLSFSLSKDVGWNYWTKKSSASILVLTSSAVTCNVAC